MNNHAQTQSHMQCNSSGYHDMVSQCCNCCGAGGEAASQDKEVTAQAAAARMDGEHEIGDFAAQICMGDTDLWYSGTRVGHVCIVSHVVLQQTRVIITKVADIA